jgi:hypothetical protein
MVISPGTPVSSSNKTDGHNITEILLKVALNIVGNSYPDLGQVQKCGWVIICCTPFIVLKMYDKMYCVNTGHTQSYTSQYS